MKAANTMNMIRAGASRHIFPTDPPPIPQSLEWPRSGTLFHFSGGLSDEMLSILYQLGLSISLVPF